MNDTKFTPGPWWVSENMIGNPEIRTHRDKLDAGDLNSNFGAGMCSSIGDHTEKRTSGNEIHNAHLIAAAPELYEALINIVGSGEIPYCQSDPLIVAAGEALAKARGES